MGEQVSRSDQAHREGLVRLARTVFKGPYAKALQSPELQHLQGTPDERRNLGALFIFTVLLDEAGTSPQKVNTQPDDPELGGLWQESKLIFAGLRAHHERSGGQISVTDSRQIAEEYPVVGDPRVTAAESLVAGLREQELQAEYVALGSVAALRIHAHANLGQQETGAA